MKRFIILAVAAITLAGCAIKDIPVVEFSESSYTVSSAGEESFIIPVSSTGIDDVVISYEHDGDRWEIEDPTTGNRVPAEGWVQVVRIIERHEPTRALAQWTSGIEIKVLPNDTGVERKAYVKVRSFMAEASVTIKQGF